MSRFAPGRPGSGEFWFNVNPPVGLTVNGQPAFVDRVQAWYGGGVLETLHCFGRGAPLARLARPDWARDIDTYQKALDVLARAARENER